MRCVSLYFKAFTRKTLSPLFTVRNFNRCNKSLWLRGRCSCLSSSLFPLSRSSKLKLPPSLFCCFNWEAGLWFLFLWHQQRCPGHRSSSGASGRWWWLRGESGKRGLKVRSCLLCWTLRILFELPVLMGTIKPHEISSNWRLTMH